MNFKEIIESMGYKIIDHTADRIVLSKPQEHSITSIVFNMQEKYLNGAIQSNGYLNSDIAMEDFQRDYLSMKKDLKSLQLHSGYKIINWFKNY